MTDDEMIIKLHDVARIMESADNPSGFELRQIADRFAEYVKATKEARHLAMQG